MPRSVRSKLAPSLAKAFNRGWTSLDDRSHDVGFTQPGPTADGVPCMVLERVGLAQHGCDTSPSPVGVVPVVGSRLSQDRDPQSPCRSSHRGRCARRASADNHDVEAIASNSIDVGINQAA